MENILLFVCLVFVRQLLFFLSVSLPEVIFYYFSRSACVSGSATTFILVQVRARLVGGVGGGGESENKSL